MKRKTIRIAIQKEGRLKGPSIKFLKSLGIEITDSNGRMLVVPCKNSNIEILYVRHGDIPRYVENSTADFAIVGDNILFENNFNVNKIKKLNFGKCSLVIAVPSSSHIRKIQELEGERIATSYPNSLRKFLREKNINASIVEIKGSVEVAPSLGLADAICDLVRTGNTLKENNLRPIEKIFNSVAVLIESRSRTKEKREFINKSLTSFYG